jgi:hypothetical protein
VSSERRTTRYLFRASPPPLTSVALAIDYANMALDQDLSLYERYCAASIAVRLLATIKREHLITSIATLLRDSGLCEKFRDIVGVPLCEGEEAEGSRRVSGDEAIVRRLVRIVNACELGEMPVTEELVLALAQAVIVILAPQLRPPPSQQVPELG